MLESLFGPKDLWSASKRGDVLAIQRFVTAGADVNAKKDGWTPLHFATEHNQIGATRELVKCGAGVNVRDQHGFTALMLAKTLEHIQLLLQLGADINKHNKNGATALEYAALSGKEEIVKFLLSKGADPNLSSGKGFMRGPLVAAVDGKNIKVVEALLQAGAVVNAESGKDSALASAALQGRLDMVSLLLKTGADPSHIGYGRWTALMAAARSKDADVTRVLLEAGADVNVKSLDGKTALDIALEEKAEELTNMLRNACAKRGNETEESEVIAKRSTFWQLPDNFVLSARIDPWPPEEFAQLRIEISENDYNQSFSGAIEFRITSSERNAETWLPLADGKKNDEGDIVFSSPVRLLKGTNFLQFRLCSALDQEFIYPEAWTLEIK